MSHRATVAPIAKGVSRMISQVVISSPALQYMHSIGGMRIELTKAGASYVKRRKAQVARFKEHDKRKRIRADLVAADPHCSFCGCELVDEIGADNQAHLVVDRLSCLAHANHVRNICYFELITEESGGGIMLMMTPPEQLADTTD